MTALVRLPADTTVHQLATVLHRDGACIVTDLGDQETPQPLHRDQEVWPVEFPVGEEPEVSVMWPLNTDFTEANGATRVVAGPRTGPRDEAFIGPDELEPAVMRRGSVLLWTGSTYHGGGRQHLRRTPPGVQRRVEVFRGGRD